MLKLPLYILCAILMQWLMSPAALASAIEEDFDYIRKQNTALEQAILIYESGDKEGALIAFRQAYSLFKEFPNETLRGFALVGIGHSYLHTGKTDSALIMYHDAYNILYDRDPFMTARVASAIATMYNFKGEYRKALQYNIQYLNYVESINKQHQIASGYRQIGDNYLDLNILDSSMQFLAKALTSYKTIGDVQGETRTRNSLALYYTKIGSLRTAIENYLIIHDNLNRYPELFNDGERVINNKNIAESFIVIDEWDKANLYAKKALEISRRKNYSTYKAHILVQMGRILEHQNQVDTALVYFNQALDIYRQKKLTVSQISTLRAIGILYFSRQEMEPALLNLRRALVLADSIQEPSEQMHLSYKLSKIFINLNQLDRAFELAQRSLKLAIRSRNKPVQRAIYLALSEIYEKKYNSTQALFYQKKAAQVRDSILTDQQRRTLYEMEIKYQSHKKEEKIKQLDLQNAISKIELDAKKKQNNFLLAGLLFLLLSLGIISALYKKISGQKKVINSALEQKEALLREIHHRVKNNLQVISSLLSIQSRQINDPTAVEAIQESRNRVRSMALIHQNLYQEEDLIGVDLPKYIKNLADTLVHTYQLDRNLNITTDVDDIHLDVDTIIPLGLILNELISNALKYAFENVPYPQMRIMLKENNNILQLSVQDNGIGLPKNFDVDQSNGMGFKLIRTFLKKLKGKLRIEKTEGAKIVLSFPK